METCARGAQKASAWFGWSGRADAVQGSSFDKSPEVDSFDSIQVQSIRRGLFQSEPKPPVTVLLLVKPYPYRGEDRGPSSGP